MSHDKLTEAIQAEVNRVLAMSWNRYGHPEYWVNRLRLLAHLCIEAGDYETPQRIVDEWKARYTRYVEIGGKGRFRELLIPLTEDDRQQARDRYAAHRSIADDLLFDPLTRQCPFCRAAVGINCRLVDGDFHDERYNAPDAVDPLNGLTDYMALRH